MSALYQSQTRSLPFAELDPAIRSALEAHARAHQLTLGDVTVFSTHRENPVGSGLMGKLFGRRSNSTDPDASHDLVLVLHPSHLLVATAGAKRGISVLSLPLVQASVKRGLALALPGADSDDDGVTITGFEGELGRPGSFFFGLGPSEADACMRALERAVHAAENPS